MMGWMLILGAVILDRLLKAAALTGILQGSLFGFNYPRFTLHQNYGLAFDIRIALPLIIGVSVVCLLALLFWNFRRHPKHPPETFAWVLFFAGAASNLYDRVAHGFVIDFLEIIPGSIWNIADFMIIVAIFLLLKAHLKSNKARG